MASRRCTCSLGSRVRLRTPRQQLRGGEGVGLLQHVEWRRVANMLLFRWEVLASGRVVQRGGQPDRGAWPAWTDERSDAVKTRRRETHEPDIVRVVCPAAHIAVGVVLRGALARHKEREREETEAEPRARQHNGRLGRALRLEHARLLTIVRPIAKLQKRVQPIAAQCHNGVATGGGDRGMNLRDVEERRHAVAWRLQPTPLKATEPTASSPNVIAPLKLQCSSHN